MKKTLLLTNKGLMLLPLLLLLKTTSAQENIYSKSYIKSIMDKVNSYQYNHPWRENDDNWIRGTYYTGVMAAFQSTGDKKYLQQCDTWGKKLGWKIPEAKKGANESGANLLT